MTAEEFHAIENPVGMAFWFAPDAGNVRHKGVCVKVFRDMALMKYRKHSNSEELGTTYMHCRQLRRTKDEPDDVIEKPKLAPDPVKMAMFQAEEKRNHASKPTSGRRRIPVKDITTGEVYGSMRDAERVLGMPRDYLAKRISRNKAVKGHVFIRLEG